MSVESGIVRATHSSRAGVGAALVVWLAVGCNFDRERPSPTALDSPATLSVEVLAPRTGTAVFAGTDLNVEVLARDLSGDRLAGVGYVVRRSGSGGNATLDSAALGFEGTAQASHEFTFAVPAALPTNTQLDIFGIAFGPGSQVRLSIPRSIVVVPCPPGQPGC